MTPRIGTLLGSFVVVVAAACATGDDAATSGQGGSAPPPGCGEGETDCDGACVVTASDPDHCGACGKACGAGYQCIAAKCQLVCEGGSKVCGDGCADVSVDPDNCGDCGKVCPKPAGGVAVCVAGACDGACKAPMKDCNYDPGDGCEADTASSIYNCGACGSLCPQYVNQGTAQCKEGKCVVACNPGRGDCNGVAFDGCESELTTDSANCGQCGKVCDPLAQEFCVESACIKSPFAFGVLDKKDIVYAGIPYLLLKVKLLSATAVSDSWCQEYTNLCQSFGYKPTGCGSQFSYDGYGECKTKYLSDGVSNSLGCNPSGGVVSAAQQNGFFDATYDNSFAFHYCDFGSCSKTLCSGPYCNAALIYIDGTKSVGFTLCKK